LTPAPFITEGTEIGRIGFLYAAPEKGGAERAPQSFDPL